jgi:FkbM family methyltransferase
MQFFGQWNPPVDQVLYENYFKNNKTGFFIESGGYDGVSLSCCLFFEKLGWRGINVEPAKNHFADCSKNRPKAINLNVGLGDKEDILTFKNVVSPHGSGAGNGSFEHDDVHLKELKTYGVSFEEYDIPIITYRKMIQDHKVSHVDLMCLDVEGFEFKVMEGMKGCNILPDIMCIEYSYLGLKKLIQYMKDFGYHFNFISFNNAYFSKEIINRDDWFGKTDKECTVIDGQITWLDITDQLD